MTCSGLIIFSSILDMVPFSEIVARLAGDFEWGRIMEGGESHSTEAVRSLHHAYDIKGSEDMAKSEKASTGVWPCDCSDPSSG
jgi:hypothetical protein